MVILDSVTTALSERVASVTRCVKLVTLQTTSYRYDLDKGFQNRDCVINNKERGVFIG